jgi:hypothetical protein
MTGELKCSRTLILNLVSKHEGEQILSTPKAQTYLRKINLNVIIPHPSRFSKWMFTKKFTQKNSTPIPSFPLLGTSLS